MNKSFGKKQPVKYSVIIPVYNTAKYVSNCLDSVIAQEYQNIEIIIVNDGSTDGSLDICTFYQQRDVRIKVVNQVNQGLSEARNSGMRIASGDYILFLDSDDWWHGSFLKQVNLYIEQNDKVFDVILGAGEKVEYASGESFYIGEKFNCAKLQGIDGETALNYVLKNEPRWEWYVWRAVYRRDYILEHDFFFTKGIYYEDVDWLPIVINEASSVGYIDEVFVNYRFHNPTSILNTPNTKKTKDKILVSKKIMAYADSILNQELSNRLKTNISDLFLSAIGDYQRGCYEVKSLLIDNIEILNYNTKKYGIWVRRLTKILGIEKACYLINIVIKVKNRRFL